MILGQATRQLDDMAQQLHLEDLEVCLEKCGLQPVQRHTIERSKLVQLLREQRLVISALRHLQLHIGG